MKYMLIQADATHIPLADKSVNCVVTSPPYWGLRDYGVDGQIGLEADPGAYTARLVDVFREVRRVLRDDGTLWLNMGDVYVHGKPGGACVFENGRTDGRKGCDGDKARGRLKVSTLFPAAKVKDLIGLPWLLAFGLQRDGWYLRSDIIWHKPNPMPESVRDRPTKAHEYLFLMSKSERYWYHAEAIKEPANHAGRVVAYDGTQKNCRSGDGVNDRRTLITRTITVGQTRNSRSVWTLPTQPFKGAHFATFPVELARRCIVAGCPEGGTVLDPFNGAGTTGVAAVRNGRQYIGIELKAEYVEMSRVRIEAALNDKPPVRRKAERVRRKLAEWGLFPDLEVA